MTEGKRPRGRPAKPVEERKANSLSFRIRPGLRGHLQAAAEAGGRSISEEAEYRLERSFDTPGSLDTQNLLFCVATSIDFLERNRNATWRAEPGMRAAAVQLFSNYLEAFADERPAQTTRERIAEALITNDMRDEANRISNHTIKRVNEAVAERNAQTAAEHDDKGGSVAD